MVRSKPRASLELANSAATRPDRAAFQKAIGARTYASFKRHLAGSNCQLCGLSADRTHIVVDRGTPKAEILLVGEGPGAEEDRLGSAFVGASGKLLDEMLREAEIDPKNDVLIANVVKCRPPENRTPTASEVAECLPLLRRQVELVRPRFVGLLGATAIRHLLGKKGAVTPLVGRFTEHDSYPGIEFILLYHPAYILRSRSKRGVMVSWLRKLKERCRMSVADG